MLSHIPIAISRAHKTTNSAKATPSVSSSTTASGGTITSVFPSTIASSRGDTSTTKLRNWFFTLDSKSDGAFSVHINGYKISTNNAETMRCWRTSPILECIDATTLRTERGRLYKLVGAIDAETAIVQKYPDELVSAFAQGFPSNWKRLLERYHRKKSKSANAAPMDDTSLLSDIDQQTGDNDGEEIAAAAASPRPMAAAGANVEIVAEHTLHEEDFCAIDGADDDDDGDGLLASPSVSSPRACSSKAPPPAPPPPPLDQSLVPVFDRTLAVFEALTTNNTIGLVSWRVVLQPSDSGAYFPDFLVGVQGIRTDNGLQWKSSAITAVIAPRAVRTVTHVYNLIGPINAKESLHAGLPREFVASFVNGFPSDWQAVIAKYVEFMKQLYMKTVQNEDVAPPPSFAASKEAAAKAKTKRSAKTKGAAPPPPQSKALVAARTASKRNGDDSSPTAAKAKVSRSGRVLKPRLQSWEGERIVYDAYGNPIGAHATVIATSSSTSTTSTRRSSLNKLAAICDELGVQAEKPPPPPSTTKHRRQQQEQVQSQQHHRRRYAAKPTPTTTQKAAKKKKTTTTTTTRGGGGVSDGGEGAARLVAYSFSSSASPSDDDSSSDDDELESILASFGGDGDASPTLTPTPLPPKRPKKKTTTTQKQQQPKKRPHLNNRRQILSPESDDDDVNEDEKEESEEEESEDESTPSRYRHRRRRQAPTATTTTAAPSRKRSAAAPQPRAAKTKALALSKRELRRRLFSSPSFDESDADDDGGGGPHHHHSDSSDESDDAQQRRRRRKGTSPPPPPPTASPARKRGRPPASADKKKPTTTTTTMATKPAAGGGASAKKPAAGGKGGGKRDAAKTPTRAAAAAQKCAPQDAAAEEQAPKKAAGKRRWNEKENKRLKIALKTAVNPKSAADWQKIANLVSGDGSTRTGEECEEQAHKLDWRPPIAGGGEDFFAPQRQLKSTAAVGGGENALMRPPRKSDISFVELSANDSILECLNTSTTEKPRTARKPFIPKILNISRLSRLEADSTANSSSYSSS